MLFLISGAIPEATLQSHAVVWNYISRDSGHSRLMGSNVTIGKTSLNSCCERVQSEDKNESFATKMNTDATETL